MKKWRTLLAVSLCIMFLGIISLVLLIAVALPKVNDIYDDETRSLVSSFWFFGIIVSIGCIAFGSSFGGVCGHKMNYYCEKCGAYIPDGGSCTFRIMSHQFEVINGQRYIKYLVDFEQTCPKCHNHQRVTKKFKLRESDVPEVYIENYIKRKYKTNNVSNNTLEQETQAIPSYEQIISDIANASGKNNSENNTVELIKKYKELYDSGAITEDEYNEKKKELLEKKA